MECSVLILYLQNIQHTITNITITFPIQLLIVSFIEPFVKKLRIANINLVKSVGPLSAHKNVTDFCVKMLYFY